MNIFKNKKTFVPMALVYADELKELEKLIDIIGVEKVDSINNIERFRITIFEKDKNKLHQIMSDSYVNDYGVRKR